MSERPLVVLVDGSAVRRDFLRTELRLQFELKVCQTFAIARDRIAGQGVAAVVVGLDDGGPVELDFLGWLQAHCQVPVLLCVSPDMQLGPRHMRWENIARPTALDAEYVQRITAWLRKTANVARVAARAVSAPIVPPSASAQRFEALPRTPASSTVICIGISTGGPDTLEDIFSRLPRDLPPIVVVQHMPRAYTAPLAERLDRSSELEVSEAVDGQELARGTALIAPGDRHLRLVRRSARIIAELDDSPPVDRHRPSVNVLFESAATAVGRSTIALIMTGMGDDGVRGLLALRRVGAVTLAQDAESSTVFGMPQRAIQAGAAEHIVSLRDIPERLMQLAMRPISAPV